MSVRGEVPDPTTIDWKAACERLYDACYALSVKRDRTPEEQAAVENWTQAMVEISDILHGHEVGIMGLPLEPSPFQVFPPGRKEPS